MSCWHWGFAASIHQIGWILVKRIPAWELLYSTYELWLIMSSQYLGIVREVGGRHALYVASQKTQCILSRMLRSKQDHVILPSPFRLASLEVTLPYT